MTINRPLRVFLCHSNNDKPAVRELYQKLSAESWIEPWLDEEEIYPGHDWNMEIEKAVEAADAIIVCLSKGSITKEGYVQREIRIALDYADYKPEGTLYIIPIRLEDCTPPKRLGRWQYANYFEGHRERASQRLLVSLRKRAESLNLRFDNDKIGKDEIMNFLDQVHIKELNKEEEKFIDKGHYSAQKYLEDFASKHSKRPEELRTDKMILSNGMEFMHIPAGRFIMGSNDHGNDEVPQHVVDISYDYWMGRFPITNEQYDTYIASLGAGYPPSVYELQKEHPVVQIQWIDAIKFCAWLNDSLRRELPSLLTFALPTEAQWEKAARGTDGRKYPWGNDFDQSRCNTSGSEKQETTPVGLYSPQGDSPFGCADMAGNVWEWTHSLKGKYPYKVDDGREDEEILGSRVLRGGSFYGGDWGARCACRYIVNFNLFSNVGFRVCLVPITVT